jgi:hypothetical protein
VKIRLVGSSDLVRAWSAELERAYGIKGAIYPSRHGSHEIRVYFDLDDRQAAAVVGLAAAPAQPDGGTAVARRPARTPRVKHGR